MQGGPGKETRAAVKRVFSILNIQCSVRDLEGCIDYLLTVAVASTIILFIMPAYVPMPLLLCLKLCRCISPRPPLGFAGILFSVK